MSESHGLLTSPQITKVSQLTNDSGYLADAGVRSVVTSYGYQTDASVRNIVTSYGYQTAAQVSSAISNSGSIKWTYISSVVASTTNGGSVGQPNLSGYAMVLVKLYFNSTFTSSSGAYQLSNSGTMFTAAYTISAGTTILLSYIRFMNALYSASSATSWYIYPSGSITTTCYSGMPTVTMNFYGIAMP